MAMWMVREGDSVLSCSEVTRAAVTGNLDRQRGHRGLCPL